MSSLEKLLVTSRGGHPIQEDVSMEDDDNNDRLNGKLQTQQ